MSAPRLTARAQRRFVACLVAVLATSLAALGLGPVPAANAADPVLSFVAASSSAGNRLNHTVGIPGAVQAGDTMVLFMTVNTLNGGALATPNGWTLLRGQDGTASRGRAWTKQATAADAGTNVTITTTVTIKDTMSVAAYRSDVGTSAVTASAQTVGTTAATSHTAPQVAVAQPGSWLVNSWSEKSSTEPMTWTKPATSTTRATPAATGSGKVSSLLADSGAPVATGTAAGRTATTSAAGGGTQLFSVVVSPGTATTPPANQAPVPSFTTSCVDLVCSFDAAATTDPDDDPLTYAWNYGDTTTGTGETSSRTYATAGSRTVTLTVDDGTTTAQTTRTVNPTTAGTAATLSYVGTGSSAGSRANHTVRIPASVRAGDRLVLFMTVNTLTGTLGSPAGWTLLQNKNGTATRGRAWTKQATSTDANTNVTVTSTTAIKDTMSVAAYRSTGGNPTITTSEQTAGTTSTTTHTSPSVAVGQAGSWLVNSWSEKSSSAQTWTPPTTSSSRATPAATGTGKVSSLLADSNGPVATGTAAGRMARTSLTGGGTQLFSVVVSPGTGPATPPGPGTTPPPGHTAIVPQTPRTDMPKISDGEIFDLAVAGNRVFIAGTFTSIQNQRPGNTQTYNQAGLASYYLDTGLVDASFRPDFAGAEVNSVAVTPDGTKLFAAGAFSTVNGVARSGLARLDLTTGAPVGGFTANTDARSTEVVASNTTVYAGGRFTRVNNVPRGSLAAVDAATGQVDSGFVNNITRGVGVSGAIGVQELVLTHDMEKLVVVHTGLEVAGSERAGAALIDTTTKALLPWHTRLWEDNLEFVGGIQRAYGAAISPDDSYFVVTSGSGGDRPPINDTAMAFPMSGGDDVEPMWISRCFDSIYSVAISERAVYIGGHFGWNESPTANDPWPGQADIGYGTGQGLSAYSLGQQVVSREHLGALDPATGKALEWDPGSNSYEGNKAMLATPRGLITGGDATTQGGENVARIAFFDFNSVPAGNGVQTAVTEPIMGRVVNSGSEFEVQGTASAAGGVDRVEVSIRNRVNGQYLQDDLTTWGGGGNTVDADLDTPGAASTTWSLPVTVAGNVKMLATARTVASNAAADPSPDTKKFETFNLTDAPPLVGYTAPAAGSVPTQTFTVTGTTADDKGVVSLTMTMRDEANRFLQDDGTVAPAYNSFRIDPDVPGALNTTWQREFTVPEEGLWKAQVRANDTGGQSSLDTADRNWIVSATAQAPVVSITSPSAVTPPTVPQAFTVEPGQPITFTGAATDDGTIAAIDIALVNNSTQEYLATDGSFGRNNGLNVFRLRSNVDQQTASWTYTTPFNLTPGAYQFAVLATDNDGIITPTTMWAVAGFTAQVPGDTPPKATLTAQGLQPPATTLDLTLAGTATDNLGVAEVRVALRDADTARYAKEGGGTQADYTTIPATLASPGATSTTWTLPVTLPTQGDWTVTAVAIDTVGQYDFTSTGATARYLAYPGDAPPTFNMDLLAPTDGTAFPDGRIFVSGRAEDDQAMAKVEVSITNSTNQYLRESGVFSTSATPIWIPAFLTSPGTPGSNFSYTSPVVPTGSYTVRVRGTDQHDLVTTVPPARSVTVSQPPNNKPVAVIDPPACTNNICQFDARHSTDENAATLTYAWNFGTNAGTGTGPNPKKTYTAPGTYTVTLTAKDQWGALSDPVTTTVTIGEPPGNVAPNPVINSPSCAGLTCNFSAVGTIDPNTGDTITYAWNFDDLLSGANNGRTGSAASHVFTASGTYTVALTATDGWGRSATITRVVTVATP